MEVSAHGTDVEVEIVGTVKDDMDPWTADIDGETSMPDSRAVKILLILE